MPCPPAAYEAAFNYLKSNGFRVPSQLQKVHVILIDEVFLLTGVLFTLADVILRGARNKFSDPFGDVTMLIIGDPLQGGAIPDDDCTLGCE